MPAVDPSSPCPCGTGAPLSQCCAPFHAGAAAPTALALMRSRYSAYVVGAIDYLVASHHESSREQIDVPATERWSRQTVWQGLEILATEQGQPEDDDGVVEFIARGITDGAPFAQRERSRFRKQDGRWYYLDGKARAEPARKKAAEVGPNQPCPCGSGRKYKKCHGAV
jgi:SEC-C motif domain protein